jgi:hypothetical protein
MMGLAAIAHAFGKGTQYVLRETCASRNDAERSKGALDDTRVCRSGVCAAGRERMHPAIMRQQG